MFATSGSFSVTTFPTVQHQHWYGDLLLPLQDCSASAGRPLHSKDSPTATAGQYWQQDTLGTEYLYMPGTAPCPNAKNPCISPEFTVELQQSCPLGTTTTLATSEQCTGNQQSGAGSVEIKVEVDPNLYVNCDGTADGDGWSDTRGVKLAATTITASGCPQHKCIEASSCKHCDISATVSTNGVHVVNKGESCPEETEEEEEEEEEQTRERGWCSSNVECGVDIDTEINNFFTFKCDNCTDSTVFSDFRSLSEHCQYRHQHDACVTCCDQLLKSHSDLLQHLLQHKHKYSCADCHKTFANKAAWKSHSRRHASKSDSVPFQCKHCSKRFSSKYGLANHQNLHLPEDERPYKCRHCNKGFGAKHAMTKHERTHLPDEERLSYVCDICGKRFGYASTLDGHQRHVHQNERPFVCHVCAKTFPIKGALTYHLTTHEVQDRVQCTECGIWLKNEKILRIHKKCHQGESFSCPHCDKVSSTRNNLRMHMKRHSDARPHPCPLCIRAFKTPRDLKTHMVQHTGQKPYSCPFCPKSFASPSNFYAHRKMKHKVTAGPFETAQTSANAHLQY